jgi:hypothetical protein
MNLDFINSLQPILWIKIATLVVIGFYVVFTFIVFSQARVMGKILDLPHAESLLRTVSILNIVSAISLFGLAIAIL